MFQKFKKEQKKHYINIAIHNSKTTFCILLLTIIPILVISYSIIDEINEAQFIFLISIGSFMVNPIF